MGRLQEVLVAMNDPELLAAIERPEGLVTCSNADFERIEQVAGEIGMMRN